MQTLPSAIIMLYGIPKDDQEKEGLSGYLSDALERIDPTAIILLGGGDTDPGQSNRSEADTAASILVNHLGVDRRRIRSIPRGRDAREVLEILAECIEGELPDAETVQVVCLSSHQGVVAIHGERLFGGRGRLATIGPHDRKALIKRLPRDLLAILGLSSRRARALELFLREVHIHLHASPRQPQR